MKSFYEMMRILEESRSSRPFASRSFEKKEILHLGEEYPEGAWEGDIEVGYKEHHFTNDPDDVGVLMPEDWRIVGGLTKYKEGQEREGVVDMEFPSPGEKGENLPEPYKSGNKDMTGFDELIKIIWKYEEEKAMKEPEKPDYEPDYDDYYGGFPHGYHQGPPHFFDSPL